MIFEANKEFMENLSLHYYPGFKVITADPKLFLRIKSCYSGSKVITPDSRFYFRCIDPNQFKISILEFEDAISSSPFNMVGAQGER